MTKVSLQPHHSFSYKPLSLQCIGVLELHPGASDAPLVCSLVARPINSKAYDALSYVWGDPTPAALVKCVDEANEGELGIGRGLANALIAFRLPREMPRIWIDALI
jgi:hypothetical protein